MSDGEKAAVTWRISITVPDHPDIERIWDEAVSAAFFAACAASAPWWRRWAMRVFGRRLCGRCRIIIGSSLERAEE